MRKHVRTVAAASVFPERRFPLAVMEQHRHAPTAIHHHEFQELVVILAGQGRHITDRETHLIATGDVFLIERAEAHAYADTRDLSLVNILFDLRRLHIPLADVGDLPGYQALFRVEPKLRRRAPPRGRLRLTSDELANAARIVARLRTDLSRQHPGRRFAACTSLMELILFLSRCYSRDQTPENHAILRIGHLLSHIETHFSEPLRVPQLARMAHLSESSLLRAFRAVLGVSPMGHIVRVRIAKASELLRHGDVRITEAAFQCGFQDSNYFARQFRKATGRSPSQFRRDMRGL